MAYRLSSTLGTSSPRDSMFGGGTTSKFTRKPYQSKKAGRASRVVAWRAHTQIRGISPGGTRGLQNTEGGFTISPFVGVGGGDHRNPPKKTSDADWVGGTYFRNGKEGQADRPLQPCPEEFERSDAMGRKVGKAGRRLQKIMRSPPLPPKRLTRV